MLLTKGHPISGEGHLEVKISPSISYIWSVCNSF